MATEPDDVTARPRIVVGVDGSKGSVHAIDWAIQAARLISGRVEIIHAVHISRDLRIVGMVKVAHSSGQEILEDALKEANLIDPAVPMTGRLVEARPAAALLQASEGAEFLAIGARGRGGFKGLGLGSVGEQCANNAHCTVVIVRGEHNPLSRRQRK